MSNYAVICLDETGSMSGQEERVVTSLNEYIEALPKKTHVTVFKFDSNRWTQYYDGKKSDFKKMKQKDYTPGAMTPLYDAVYKSIAHAESLAKDGDKVMVMVDTDGYENASKEYTQDSIKAIVDKKKSSGWEFLFMASGIDEVAATKIGSAGTLMGMTVNAAAYARRAANYNTATLQTTSYFSGDSKTLEDENQEPFFLGSPLAKSDKS